MKIFFEKYFVKIFFEMIIFIETNKKVFYLQYEVVVFMFIMNDIVLKHNSWSEIFRLL